MSANILPPREPFLDSAGQVTRSWYRYLQTIGTMQTTVTRIESEVRSGGGGQVIVIQGEDGEDGERGPPGAASATVVQQQVAPTFIFMYSDEGSDDGPWWPPR